MYFPIGEASWEEKPMKVGGPWRIPDRFCERVDHGRGKLKLSFKSDIATIS